MGSSINYIPLLGPKILLIKSCITLRTLNYGNYGICLIWVMQDLYHQPSLNRSTAPFKKGGLGDQGT